MSLDPELLEILACPESKAPLYYFEEEGFLFCYESRRKYPIEDGIPVLLVDESEQVDEAEAERLLALARERGIEPGGSRASSDE